MWWQGKLALSLSKQLDGELEESTALANHVSVKTSQGSLASRNCRHAV